VLVYVLQEEPSKWKDEMFNLITDTLHLTYADDKSFKDYIN